MTLPRTGERRLGEGRNHAFRRHREELATLNGMGGTARSLGANPPVGFRTTARGGALPLLRLASRTYAERTLWPLRWVKYLVVFVNALPSVVSGCVRAEGWISDDGKCFVTWPESSVVGNQVFACTVGIPAVFVTLLATLATGVLQLLACMVLAAFTYGCLLYFASDGVRRLFSRRHVFPARRPAHAEVLVLGMAAHESRNPKAKADFGRAWAHLASQCKMGSIWLLGTSNNRKLTAKYLKFRYGFHRVGGEGCPIGIQKIERRPRVRADTRFMSRALFSASGWSLRLRNDPSLGLVARWWFSRHPDVVGVLGHWPDWITLRSVGGHPLVWYQGYHPTLLHDDNWECLACGEDACDQPLSSQCDWSAVDTDISGNADEFRRLLDCLSSEGFIPERLHVG